MSGHTRQVPLYERFRGEKLRASTPRVQKLATSQDGDLVRIKDHPTAAKLRVSPYLIYLNFDQFDGTLTIWYIYRM